MNPTETYQLLLQEFKEQKWWPMDLRYHQQNQSDPRFEVIIGAILTQNTAWSNVEKALENLKKNKNMNLEQILTLDEKEIQKLIKPSGFFKQKTHRLKNIADYLQKNYNGDLNSFFNRKTSEIRKELLSLKGIGPETADSILLYAGEKPVFVVDAYTKRICKRLPLKTELDYDDIQKYFEEKLKSSFSDDEIVFVYKEFHALIVELAKNFCKTKPNCKICPLSFTCKKIV